MRSDEIFTSVLKAHGLNYRTYGQSKGMPDNYYLIRLKQEYVSAYGYGKYLSDLGCKVCAKRGNEIRDLTEVLCTTSERTRLNDILSTVNAVGLDMVVVDGVTEYELTSARIEEKGKKKYED